MCVGDCFLPYMVDNFTYSAICYSGHLGTQPKCPVFSGHLGKCLDFRWYLVPGQSVLIIKVFTFGRVKNSRFYYCIGKLYIINSLCVMSLCVMSLYADWVNVALFYGFMVLFYVNHKTIFSGCLCKEVIS